MLAACSGGEKTLSPEQRVTRIEFSPEAPRLVIPSVPTLRLDARAVDASGTLVTGVTLAWGSSNPSVISLSPGASHAILTAVAAGLTTVTVTAGGVLASVDVIVSMAPVHRVDVALPASVIGIGELISASALAYDIQGTLLPGRAPQWSSLNPTIASVSPTGLVTGVSAGDATISAVIDGITGAAAVRVVSTPPNLAIHNVLLTQAVQRPDGGVPLVERGNPVLVSVFATLDRPFPAGPVPRVRLVAYRGATQVLTDERQMTGAAATSWDHGTPVHQVVLPNTIAEPGLRVLVTLNPDGTPSEASLSDNVWPTSGQPMDVAVLSVPPLRVHFVPIFLTSGGSTGTVSAGTLPEYLYATRQLHPVAEIDASIGGVFSTDVSFGDGQSSAWTAILQQLDVLRVSEGSDRYYVGALRPPPGVNFVQFGGFAYIPFDPRSTGPSTRTAVVVGVGWFNRTRHTTELVAHELGHTMGRRHAPCGGAAGPDPQYPYTSAAIGAYGYDLYSYSLNPNGLPIAYGPTSASDVMSYCTPAWISDYNYEALLNARAGVSPGASAEAAGRECECLILWGSVEGDSVRLQPSFTTRTRVALPSRRGPVSVTGETHDGRRLFHYEFEAAELDHAPTIRHFAFAIPVDEEERASLSRIRARAGNRTTEIVARGVATAPPPRANLSARRVGTGATELRWDTTAAPVVVARDPMTGRVLAIATSGRVVVRTPRSELDLNVSDGLRSATTRVRVSPR